MRAPLIHTIVFGAMVLLGAGAAALAAPYDMPGLSENGSAPPAQSPDSLAGGPPAGGPPAGDGQQCDEGFFARLFDPCDGPRWTFAGDVLALQRSSPRNQPLLTSIDDSSVLLSANDLDVPMALGIRTSAVRHDVFGFDFDLEVNYFQTDWALNTAVTAAAGLVTDVNGANFDVIDPAVRYTTGLHVGEINLRRECFDSVTLLAGFGMGELDEHYHVGGSGYFVPGTMVTLDSQTFNHLYGCQFGADVDIFEECGPLHLHLLTKTGIYGNSTSQRNRQTDSSDGLDQTLGATKNQTTVISQFGLALTYELGCHWTFRLTGSAVWLDCVALAPDQIGTTDFTANTASVDSHGNIFYYGGGAGIEARF